MVVGHQVSFPLYEDWIESVRESNQNSILQWVSQNREFPLNTSEHKNPIARTLEEIRKSVLSSIRVQEAIQLQAQTKGCSESEVLKEAEEIVDIMAHRFSLFYIRPTGFAVGNVLQKLFDSVHVNGAQAREIRELCKKNPVIFMPSHRTYLDFLFLTIICFHYQIPLPAIAAGMDFMNSAFMGAVLRRCGAFFIKRSFGDDFLYWAIFSEYVQTHIIHSDQPIEFFVEGTRSRVGKSLHPKYGLLQIALEPYIKGNVFDITVVPVSMNYDKILEESLYAYELLGFPKPKESTSGLFKARDILNKNFGNVFVTFGKPISVRDALGNSIRHTNILPQPSSQISLNQETKETIRRFAHQIVKINDNNTIITVWHVACMAMLKRLDENDNHVFNFYELHQDVKDLIDLLKQLDVEVNVNKTLNGDLRYYIKLHDDLFHPFKGMEDNFEMHLKNFPVEKEGFVPKEIMERAVSRLILTTYSNVMIHGIVEAGYVAIILLHLGLEKMYNIKEKYFEIVQILKREFVFVPGDEHKMFGKVIKKLQDSSIIELTLDTVRIINKAALQKLNDIIMPYIFHFAVVLTSIIDSKNDQISIPNLVRTTQRDIVRRYELGSGIPVRLSFLSTEPIKNTFNTLIDLKCVQRNGKEYVLNTIRLQELYSRVASYTNQKLQDEIIFEEAKI